MMSNTTQTAHLFFLYKYLLHLIIYLRVDDLANLVCIFPSVFLCSFESESLHGLYSKLNLTEEEQEEYCKRCFLLVRLMKNRTNPVAYLIKYWYWLWLEVLRGEENGPIFEISRNENLKTFNSKSHLVHWLDFKQATNSVPGENVIDKELYGWKADSQDGDLSLEDYYRSTLKQQSWHKTLKDAAGLGWYTQ